MEQQEPLRNISEIGEFTLIEELTRDFISSKDELLVGIGDDAAGILLENEKVQVISTDLLVEGVHFAFDSDKQKVDLVRQSFLTQFPHLETYITFEAPNFNLKAGNFRTQIEAELVKEKMVLMYPLNNILKEKINLPSIN